MSDIAAYHALQRARRPSVDQGRSFGFLNNLENGTSARARGEKPR
jgi:hypothetical protein